MVRRAEATGESIALDDVRVVASGATWSTRYHRPDPWLLTTPSMSKLLDGPLAAAISLVEPAGSGSNIATKTKKLALALAAGMRMDSHAIPEKTGIGVAALAEGIRAHLAEAGAGSGQVLLISQPSLQLMQEHLGAGHQIVALIGLWERVGWSHRFRRIGGHYVSVAAVDAAAGTVAYVDPYEPDAFRSIPHERQTTESPLESEGILLSPRPERWRLGADNWPFVNMNDPPDDPLRVDMALAASLEGVRIPQAILQIEAAILFPLPGTK